MPKKRTRRPPPMPHAQAMELLSIIALGEVLAARGVDPASLLPPDYRVYWWAYARGKALGEARADMLFEKLGVLH